MEDHDREISRQIKARNRAVASGALVRPPRTVAELELDEALNRAEIHHLEDRRGLIWRALGDMAMSLQSRSDMSYERKRIEEHLSTAFEVKRKLRVARELMGVA